MVRTKDAGAQEVINFVNTQQPCSMCNQAYSLRWESRNSKEAQR
ncbi:hypothetical protein [Methanomassiliicoccus luminyensis]|nr:hypothetical protein [Methanomassiliicoccus luminyensis]